MHRRHLLAGLGAIPDMVNIGFPIVEAESSGDFVETKHPGSAVRVTVATVKEQRLHELGDPTNYLTPGCRTDSTNLRLR